LAFNFHSPDKPKGDAPAWAEKANTTAAAHSILNNRKKIPLSFHCSLNYTIIRLAAKRSSGRGWREIWALTPQKHHPLRLSVPALRGDGTSCRLAYGFGFALDGLGRAGHQADGHKDDEVDD
jgi:hypothetical protein